MRSTLPAPVDAHVHFRQSPESRHYVVQHARAFEYALAMPNTDPPLLTQEQAGYYASMLSLQTRMQVLPCAMLTPYTVLTPGIWKLYPAGVTTNSDHGYTDRQLHEVLPKQMEELAKLDCVLCIHAEMPDNTYRRHLPWTRESLFLEFLEDKQLPPRTVLEHITTARAVDFVQLRRIHATIALHHMLFSANDVLSHKFRPHRWCAPMPKSDSDVYALRAAAMLNSDRFMLGSDSAPHAPQRKLATECCAGCYTAPHLIESLVSLFYEQCFFHVLPKFASLNAREFYRLPPPSREIELEEQDWIVPPEVDGVVPLLAGKVVKWKIVSTQEAI